MIPTAENDLSFLLEHGFPNELIGKIIDRTGFTVAEITAAVKAQLDSGTAIEELLADYREEAPEIFAGRGPVIHGRQFPPLSLEKWRVTDTGVKCVETKGGKDLEIQVSPIPLLPSALLHNVDTGEEKVELSFYKRGQWHSITVLRSEVANKSKIVNLADRGVEVSTTTAGRLSDYLSSVIAGSLDEIPYRASSSSLGWHGDEFSPYTEHIVFDGEDYYRGLYNAVKEKGDFAAWLDFIGPLRSNVELRLCMAASFASPLIARIGENPFVFHLWGGTGTGKTVALMVAMSIWGDPTAGKLTRTMNMTANAMLQTAAVMKNIPFAGDELQTIKNAFDGYDKLIMQITEGIDRGRMKFDKLQPVKSWACAFLFTGEEPCTRSNSGGGVFNRVIEIECKSKLIQDGNAVANFVRENYGIAGKQLVEDLKRSDYRPRYRQLKDNIIQTHDTTEKQAGAMALLLLADEIASRLFWPSEEPLTVEQLRPYLHSTEEVDTPERAYSFVLDLIASNSGNFLDENGCGDSFQVWGKLDDSGGVYFINSILTDKLKEAGFDLAAVKSKWLERGYSRRDRNGNFRHPIWIRKATASCTYIRPKPGSGPLPVTEEDELPF